jgi:molybdate transport repressor ModE-like protein
MAIRVEIEPTWRFRREGDLASNPVMLDLLNGIRVTGKITHAASRAGLSYRHAWNLIEEWSGYFGAPLVERRQGSGTTLTPFGDKLVWAGQRLQARLGPQLQNLAQELETEINQLLPSGPTVIRVHASHGFAVSKLRELLLREKGLGVDLRYVNNQTSLVSLAHDGCNLAGMHVPQGLLRKKAIAAIKDWLVPSDHRVISFVTRDMGLMVRPGNPFGIVSLPQLFNPSIRFVNRDPDSGTRLLFDQLLAQENLEGSSIDGYERVEYTHAAVAAYVASGMADVTFGVEAAARQFHLDFVRLVTEDYFFICRKSFLETAVMERVLEIMRGEEFQSAIGRLPGYQLMDAGSVKTLSQFFRRTA